MTGPNRTVALAAKFLPRMVMRAPPDAGPSEELSELTTGARLAEPDGPDVPDVPDAQPALGNVTAATPSAAEASTDAMRRADDGRVRPVTRIIGGNFPRWSNK